MICSAIIWRLVNLTSTINANSSCYFMFGFIASLLGQIIPFREPRPMQKMILQLTIFLTFILGNIYEGLIVSFSVFHSRTKLTTIEEMIESYSWYDVDPTFSYQLNGSDYYQQMRPKIKHIDTMVIDYKNVSFKNVVVITRCSLVDFYFVDKLHGFKGSKQFYLLNEKFNSFFVKIPIAATTFFHQRLNEFLNEFLNENF